MLPGEIRAGDVFVSEHPNERYVVKEIFDESYSPDLYGWVRCLVIKKDNTGCLEEDKRIEDLYAKTFLFNVMDK